MTPRDRANKAAEAERRINGEPERFSWWRAGTVVLVILCLVVLTMMLGRVGNGS